MRKEVLTAVIVVLMIAGLGAGYIAGSGFHQAETRTPTSAATSPNAFTGQPVQAADVETANISLGRGVNDIAFSNNGSKLYLEQVATETYGVSYSLTVFDTSSNTRVASVSLPPYPQITDGAHCSALIVDDSTGAVYITYMATAGFRGKLVAINGSTDTVMGVVPLPPGVCTPSLDSKTNVLWAVATHPAPGQPHGLVGSVFGVNASTGSIVENVSLGFAPTFTEADPNTGMVYAVGCSEPTAYVCSSERLAIIDGANGSLVTTVDLNNPFNPSMTLDPSTDIVYVSGGSQFVAINGTNGNVILRVDLQTCGAFDINYLAAIPSLDQVVLSPLNSSNLLVYDGTTGSLVNAYSFPILLGHPSLSDSPMYQGYDAITGELSVLVGTDMIVLHDVRAAGNATASLIGAGCGQG